MYKSLELYPRFEQDKPEYAYISCALMERMRGTYGIEYRKYFHRGKLLLGDYLSLAEANHWNLSCDVNYAYATVKYLPEEIHRRVIRYGGEKKSFTYILQDIAFDWHFSFPKLFNAAKYGKRRTPRDYARLMLLISSWEQQKGFPDAMIFEE